MNENDFKSLINELSVNFNIFNKLHTLTYYALYNKLHDMWCPRTDSNRGPIDYKSIALPAELQGLEGFL